MKSLRTGYRIAAGYLVTRFTQITAVLSGGINKLIFNIYYYQLILNNWL